VAVAWLLARVLQRRLNIKELAVQTVAQKPGRSGKKQQDARCERYEAGGSETVCLCSVP